MSRMSFNRFPISLNEFQIFFHQKQLFRCFVVFLGFPISDPFTTNFTTFFTKKIRSLYHVLSFPGLQVFHQKMPHSFGAWCETPSDVFGQKTSKSNGFHRFPQVSQSFHQKMSGLGILIFHQG